MTLKNFAPFLTIFTKKSNTQSQKMNPFCAAGIVIFIQLMKSSVILVNLLKREEKMECDYHVLVLNM